MLQSRRTSNPGERLDNAHPRSYLRFASSSYEFIVASFLPAVIQAAPHFANSPPPALPVLAVADGFARAFRHDYRLHARKRLIGLCPSLTPEQLKPLTEHQASLQEQLAAARDDNGMGDRSLPPPSMSGPYFANRRAVAMLVGAAWINLPAGLADASSGRAISERFEDGIPTGQKTDLRDQVRRGKALFLEQVRQDALREGLIAADGLPRLYARRANIESALRAVWADPAIRRLAATDGDAAETVRRLAYTGELYIMVWEALQVPRPQRNRAAIERIAQVRSDVVDTELSAVRARIAILKAEQARRDALAG